LQALFPRPRPFQIHPCIAKLDQVFPDRKFELIIAGDIIEHLNCVGNMLSSARKVLAPGGDLIITTPNALAVKRVLGAVFLREETRRPG
jgi:2-polyprenyl-3-methyl-5-hydroxy-6-metoxy-1,4-benzoquinol methylase